jgi:hypothetical protein
VQHGRGRGFGGLPLALTPLRLRSGSLGFGQDDRVKQGVVSYQQQRSSSLAARSSLLIQQGVPCAAARDSTSLGMTFWCSEDVVRHDVQSAGEGACAPRAF